MTMSSKFDAVIRIVTGRDLKTGIEASLLFVSGTTTTGCPGTIRSLSSISHFSARSKWQLIDNSNTMMAVMP